MFSMLRDLLIQLEQLRWCVTVEVAAHVGSNSLKLSQKIE